MVYEPFLFPNKLEIIQAKLLKYTKKLTKRLLVVSIMNAYDTVFKVLELSPMISILMHFCVRSEELLIKNIKVDEKGQSISKDQVEQVFNFVSCDKLLTRLENEGVEAFDTSKR